MERTSRRNLWLVVGIIGLLVLFALQSAGGGMLVGRGFGAGGGFGVRPFGGFGAPWLLGVWGIGLFIRALVWGGIIFLAVHLFRRASASRGYDYPAGDQSTAREDVSAAEILRRRYAAGEITREQYADMRRTLETML